MGVKVNDLWNISEKIGEAAMSDNVHYDTNRGNEALGSAVASAIRVLCEEQE